jgi:hypothetical protein
MFSVGRVQSALEILGDPIRAVLEKARNGSAVETADVDLAGWYAVKLAAETMDGAWIDTAVELHFIACRPLAEDTLARLVALRSKKALGDERYLRVYADHLRANLESMDAPDVMLCERIFGLLPEQDERDSDGLGATWE